MVKDLFLQILIILLPILIYRTVVSDKTDINNFKRNHYVIGFLGGVTAILCMMFPAYLTGDFIWDLRFIPLILATLYGGYKAGLIVTIMLLSFRSFIGGDALFFVFAFFPLYFFLAMLLVPYFSKFSRQKRLIVSLGVALYSYIISMIQLAFYLEFKTNSSIWIEHNISFLLFIGFLTVVAVGFAVLSIESLIENIYMRKELEKSKRELALSEQRYRSIFEFHPDYIARYDLHNKLVDINQSGENILGYTKKELLKIPRSKVVLSIENHDKEMIHKGMNTPRRFLAQLKRKDGNVIDLDMTNVPIIIEGKVVGRYGIAKDITEYNRIWTRLGKSEERYRELVENSLDTIGIIQNSCWVYINQAGLKMFGAQDKGEILGQSIFRFAHQDYHKDIIESGKRLLKNNQPGEVVVQKWHTLQKEEIDVEILGIPTSFKQREAVQVIIRNISDRKRAEQLMIKSEKLSVAGQLAAGIAHEIRNPITAIKGFIQLMERGPEIKKEYFTIIGSELSRIELILSELLMLAKPQELAFRVHHVEEIILHVITLLDSQANMHNVEIKLDIAPDIYIKCDSNQMKQVFINFIKNAIDAMDQGGCLNIDVKKQHKDVSISFEDNGAGISVEKLHQIGQPFYSTKEKGTGLGLMVSYKIIENHNGFIEVESEEGMGTKFTITLPLMEQPNDNHEESKTTPKVMQL